MTVTLFSINIDLIPLGIAVGALVLSMFLAVLNKKAIAPLMLRIFSKTRFHYDEILIRAFIRPTSALLIFFGLYFFVVFGIDALSIEPTIDMIPIYNKAIRVAIIVYFTAGTFGASDIFGEILRVVGAKIDIETGKMVSRFIGYIFKFLVIALGVVIIVSEFGYDVNGFLAGLGLGGLTFALAAQDSASNFFSGLVLLFEKPFDAGDWVKLGNLEGSIEAVTFRSTHIKDINGTKIVIPNSDITAKPIISYKDIQMRYTGHAIHFRPESDIEALKAMIAELEAILLADEEILTDTVIVKLADFTVAGVEVKLAYGTKTTDYMEYLAKKQSINLEVLHLIKKHDLQLNVFNTKI